MTASLQAVINYIEDNLKTALSLPELAKIAGYSTTHFTRVFQKATGLPLNQYLIRRRLLHGIYAIQLGEQITATALDYGFDSHSGFYRNFVNEFGASPRKYLRQVQLAPPAPYQLEHEEFLLMNQKQLKQILANWQLTNKPTPVIDGTTGKLSEHVWQVGPDHFLKALTKAALDKNLQIYQQLYPNFLQPTLNQELFVEYQNFAFFLLKRHLGSPLSSKEVLATAEQGESLGISIAKIDLLLKDVTGDFPRANLLETVVNWAWVKSLPLIKSANIPVNYLKNLQDVFPELPQQLIHRDLHGGNLLFSEEQLTFLDFDEAEINIRIFDPCYFLTSLLSEQFQQADFSKENWLHIYQQTFTGYHKISPLSTDEKRAVPLIILANQLIVLAYFADKPKYKNLLQVNIQITSWLLLNWNQLALAL